MPLIHEIANRLGTVLFLITVMMAPWLYGGVTPKGKIILCAGLVASGILAVIRFISANRFLNQNVRPKNLLLTAIPLLLLILFGLLQLVPFSEKTMKILSPGILEQRAKLLPAPDSDEAQLSQKILKTPPSSSLPVFTLSIYPKATREFVLFLTMGMIAFLCAGIFFPTPKLKRFLWIATVINGVALALFMIFTQTNSNAEFYQRLWPGAHCGPYVNKNNAAGYLIVCLGPAIALLALSVRPLADSGLTHTFADGVNRHLRKIKMTDRILLGTQSFFDFSNRYALFGLVAIGILLAASAISLSRGGTLGGIFAVLLAVCVLLSRQRLGFLLIPLWGTLILALVFIGQLGLSEPVQQRMGTLFNLDSESNAVLRDGRPINWRAALETNSSVYYGRGSGLGTYFAAIRGNDIATKNGGIFEHAENQFVETLLTAGIPGILLLGLFFVIFWTIAIFHFRRLPEEDSIYDDQNNAWKLNIPLAIGLGLATLLAGQTVAGSFDFGLCLPANFILFATLCGSFGSGFVDPDSPKRWFLERNGLRFLPGTALCSLLLLALVLGGFGFHEFQKEWRIQQALDEAVIDSSPKKLRLESLDWKIKQLEQAAREVPDDVQIPYKTALLRIVRYRLLTLQRLREKDPQFDDQQAWNASDPLVLHNRVSFLEKNGMTVWPTQFRSDPLVLENLLPAERDALTARNIAPIFPDPHLLAGILLPLISDSPESSVYVDNCVNRAVESVRYETRILYLGGVLEYAAGQKEKAYDFWNRAIALSSRYFKPILACLTRESDPDILYRYLKNILNDRFDLQEEAAVAYPSKTYPVVFNAVLKLMDETLSETRDRNNGLYYRNRARFEALSGNWEESEKDYQKAFEFEPKNIQWLLECGRMLASFHEMDRSVSIFEKAREIAPRNPTIQKELEKAENQRQKLIFDAFPETNPQKND